MSAGDFAPSPHATFLGFQLDDDLNPVAALGTLRDQSLAGTPGVLQSLSDYVQARLAYEFRRPCRRRAPSASGHRARQRRSLEWRRSGLRGAQGGRASHLHLHSGAPACDRWNREGLWPGQVACRPRRRLRGSASVFRRYHRRSTDFGPTARAGRVSRRLGGGEIQTRRSRDCGAFERDSEAG